MRQTALLLAAAVIFYLAVPWHYHREREAAAAHYQRAAARRGVAETTLEIDPALERRLVFLSGDLGAGAGPLDVDFGIARPGLCLARIVEQCQWNEIREVGPQGQATVRYDKVWAEGRIASEGFLDQLRRNPPLAGIRSQLNWGLPVTLGSRRLPLSLVEQLLPGKASALSPSDFRRIPETLRSRMKLLRGVLFTAEDPLAPTIGDLRVRFALIPVGTVTLIGVQMGDTLVPPDTGDQTQRFRIAWGSRSLDQLLGNAGKSLGRRLLPLRFFLACIYGAGFLLFSAASTREPAASAWTRRHLGWSVQGLLVVMTLVLVSSVIAGGHFTGDEAQGIESAVRFFGWVLVGGGVLGAAVLVGWMRRAPSP